jgi:hypothetical protein
VAGYSGTPLAKKLGIRDGSRVTLLAAPAGIAEALAPLPDGARILRGARSRVDVVLFFTRRSSELAREIASLKSRIEPNGGLWIAWPKRASGVPTDLAFSAVQGIGLAAGLVDTKICAVDEVWSGLRFVYRLGERSGV